MMCYMYSLHFVHEIFMTEPTEGSTVTCGTWLSIFFQEKVRRSSSGIDTHILTSFRSIILGQFDRDIVIVWLSRN